MIHRTDHFGNREAAGIVVDLFWDRRGLHDEWDTGDRHEPSTSRSAAAARGGAAGC